MQPSPNADTAGPVLPIWRVSIFISLILIGVNRFRFPRCGHSVPALVALVRYFMSADRMIFLLLALYLRWAGFSCRHCHVAHAVSTLVLRQRAVVKPLVRCHHGQLGELPGQQCPSDEEVERPEYGIASEHP